MLLMNQAAQLLVRGAGHSAFSLRTSRRQVTLGYSENHIQE
jgi:hypothetical protein